MAAGIGIERRRVPLSQQSTPELMESVDNMQGRLITNAWSVRLGKGYPDRLLNKAFMVGSAILAERRGDFEEARRIRATLDGVEERLDREEARHVRRMQEILTGLKERYGLV